MAATTSVSHHRSSQSNSNGTSHLSIHHPNNPTNHLNKPHHLHHSIQSTSPSIPNGIHPHQHQHSKSQSQNATTLQSNGTCPPPPSNTSNRPSKSIKGKGKADLEDLPQKLPSHPLPVPPPLPPPCLENISDDEKLRKIAELDERELGRHWGPHLIPLQIVIQRTIAQVFRELQLVAETSPSLDDFERKKRVIDFVIHSRRQIIKLLVLVKWSANAGPTHKIMSIVGFLQRQNQQFERTVDILKASKNSFYSARLKNFDIPTALQVLTQGYPTLPESLVERFSTKPRLKNSEVARLMHNLDNAIRFRLGATREVLPKEFRSYTIANGRVTFRVKNMFECSATLSGGQADAIWYLLHVKFLFKVLNPHGREFPTTIYGDAKQSIIEAANHGMAHCSLPTEANPNPKPPARPLMRLFAFLRELSLNYQLESLHYQASQLERTAWCPHTRLFMPPDRSSLTIHYWSYARPPPKIVMRVGQQRPKKPPPVAQGSITIKRKTEKQGVTRTRISDFLNGYPLMEKKQSDNEDDDGDHGASYTKRLQVVWVPFEIAELAIPPPPPPLTANQTRIPPPVVHKPPKVTRQLLQRLLIEPNNGILFVPNEKGAIELEVEYTELDLEHIILKAIRAQMNCILRRAYLQLVEMPTPQWHPSISPLLPYFPSVTPIEFEPFPTPRQSFRIPSSSPPSPQVKAIRVALHGRHVIKVTLDKYSGRFKILPVLVDRISDFKDKIDGDLVVIGEKEFVSDDFNSCSRKININPTGMKNLLIYLKSQVLLEQIEDKGIRMGLRAFRDMPVQWRELLIHSPRGLNRRVPPPIYHHIYPMITYFDLPGFPDYHLTILIKETGLQCSLALLRNTDGQRDLTVQDNVEILVPTFDEVEFEEDEDGIKAQIDDQFVLSRRQLKYIHHQCMVQAAIHSICQQLHTTKVPFRRVLPIPIKMMRKYGPLTLHPSSQPIGLLMLPTQSCFKAGLLDYLHPNFAIRVSVTPPKGIKLSGIKIEIQLRFQEKYSQSKVISKFLKETIQSEEFISKYRPICHEGTESTSMINDEDQKDLKFTEKDLILKFTSQRIKTCWIEFLKLIELL